ncbi:MAG: hypothetical protein ACI3X3_01420, partial [Acidaminococcus sp.]|uniref:hypothetical protein n=1 Tax=Acidaminococcus sp. TaxID=1872103 RepID=UPI003F15105E
QRVQAPFHTFHRCVKRFQIDGSIDPLLFHSLFLLFCSFYERLFAYSIAQKQEGNKIQGLL